MPGWQGSKRRDATRSAAWSALRTRVLERDGWQCTQVLDGGARCSARATQVDHCAPVSLGGGESMDNLRGMCGPHHARKSSSEGGAAWAALRAQERRPPERHPGMID